MTTSTPVSSTGRSAPPLWRDTATLGYAFANGVSQIGDEIWFVALAYTAAQLGDAGLAGLVLACATLPRALLMLLGGALTDRLDARRMMITSDVARIVVLAGALAVLAAQGVSAGLLITVGFLFGVADAFYGPACSSFPRQLVPKDQLVRLSALRQLISRFAGVLGAPIGGLLVAGYGLGGAMLTDALSFAVILVVLVLVRPRWPRAKSTGVSVRADVRDGLDYLRRTPRVRDLVITLSGLNVFVSPVLSIGLALHVSANSWGAAGLGWLSGAIGVGAAAGTAVAMKWRPARPLRAALLLLLAQAAALVLVGFASYAVTMGAMVVVGVVAGLASPLLSGAFQATVDEEYVGRASAILSVTDDGLAPVAMAAFGFLAKVTSLATATTAFGLCFAALLCFALSRPHVRDLRLDGSTAAANCP
ncbi:MFS transporter [Actinokineospora terrae]|uniref:MFS-type transporter involved in bile tolerance, Atg22 family n=1 Tax=Actinokineospora terrae TaxID=155974 RepID=A0A1H9MK43_9PSEU|nr:MFS transporter [Actinokineospora terrae]SER23827.1 MFS-type transporter involved in bile tolerance, Atg22 family [Actinokineospora terrae]